MISWQLNEIARCAAGQLVGENRAFSSISTDTRSLKAGALFVALTGPNFDGHDFVAAAAERGAAAALVARPVTVAIPQLVVADPLAALAAFAREWRRQFSIPLIGVTGSNGKTTTKELIGAILSRLGPCLVTRGNLNNHIGVPLTLLELTAKHRYAVVEMGANHQGEIAQLAAIAEPTVGIVTNAGAAHLEGFGSLQGVAVGKGEMFQALPADGVAVINADDSFAGFWRDNRASERALTFGFEQPADFMAHKVRTAGDATGFRIDFDLVTPAGTQAATLGLAGLHNLRNALGAAAAAFAAGATLDQIVAGLAAMRTVAGRLELKPAINGAFLVDDSYNANPSSLKAGLDALRSFGGARWLVLGEMMELGNSADELHAEVGRYARDSGITRLLAVGARSRFAVEAFGPGAQWFKDIDALVEDAKGSLGAGVAVLIKGSRANRLERVAAALSASPSDIQGGH
ncbi:MAG TPA: UDP-N-acetylmuramoyl-tripeptide--D-alanyl-D-alanine ligase [Steroidobacteraceae bacterium]|jgi:UDP-N-acetylmuramoyl-tripeptide--D-alanyl-D-alanine ligase